MGTHVLGLRQAPISEEVLQRIYASDQDMYPAPLAYERLRSWVERCPGLCICFQQEEVREGEGTAEPIILGAVIALPLAGAHWQQLLAGKLKETDIDAGTMFPDRSDEMGETEGRQDVGLHVFHIERFEESALPSSPDGRARLPPRFAEFGIGAIGDVARAEKAWNILGYSALTATPAGKRVFGRMGFEPTGYEEIFIAANTPGQQGTDGKIEMVCVFPGDDPRDLGTQGSHEVVGKSEMVVKYSDRSPKP